MKIQLYSDLHIEFMGYYSIPNLENDLIVLAGDIDVGMEGIKWAEELTRIHNKPVIYIAGNHEYYRNDYIELTQKFREFANQYDKLHFLEKDELIIDGVRILGCTLWTNYYGELGDDERNKNMQVLQEALTDHVLIRHNNERFTAQHAYNENQISEHWLRQKLHESFDGKTVVITHHSPSLQCIHTGFGLNEFTPGFSSNYDELVKKADYWLFGHIHCNHDMFIGNCRAISNQKGYPSERVAGNPFQHELIIDV